MKHLILAALATQFTASLSQAATSLPSSCYSAAVAAAKNAIVAEYEGTAEVIFRPTSTDKDISVTIQSSNFDDPLTVVVPVYPQGLRCQIGQPEIFNPDPS